MPVIPPGKRFPKPVRIDEQTAGLFPTLCIISSGSAISAAAYRKLGAFREDYFIEYIDIEYSLRASSQNVPVYMNAAVTLRQSNGRIDAARQALHHQSCGVAALLHRPQYGALPAPIPFATADCIGSAD